MELVPEHGTPPVNRTNGHTPLNAHDCKVDEYA